MQGVCKRLGRFRTKISRQYQNSWPFIIPAYSNSVQSNQRPKDTLFKDIVAANNRRTAVELAHHNTQHKISPWQLYFCNYIFSFCSEKHLQFSIMTVFGVYFLTKAR